MEPIILPSNSLYIALLSAAVFIVFLSNACSIEASSEKNTDIKAVTAHKSQQDIEDNIKNSYARIASTHTDICPKLLQKDLDNNIIKRRTEVMVDNYCDYFLYLRNGQRIGVELDDDQIEALLIVPTLHNFADGDYQVDSYDKHIIRLAYNGVSYKPERFTYDVTITVDD